MHDVVYDEIIHTAEQSAHITGTRVFLEAFYTAICRCVHTGSGEVLLGHSDSCAHGAVDEAGARGVDRGHVTLRPDGERSEGEARANSPTKKLWAMHHEKRRG